MGDPEIRVALQSIAAALLAGPVNQLCGDPETVREPEIPGQPLINPKPDEAPAPVTDPEIPELQDRRRPKQ